MTHHRVRVVGVVAVVLLLAACAAPSRTERYGNWTYVETRLDRFWWTELVDVAGARAKFGTGSGATVAIIGTGVLKGHEDLKTVVSGESTCGTTPADTNDTNGHGTQLAGIAAGLDPGDATRGVAPGAALIPIKVDCGVVSAAALTKGVDAAIARTPDVILIAIGGYPADSPDVSTFMADRVPRNPNILFVVASVWDGTDYAFPAWTRSANAIVVAAMTFDAEAQARERVDKTKEIPYSARRGDIWAPGRSVGTADIDPKPGSAQHARFLMHGTSPAAAIVAGCAALVKSKMGVSGAALREALVSSAQLKPTLGPPPNGRLACAQASP
jgi:subtilisin family serine protease